jgi:hypothetical protein
MARPYRPPTDPVLRRPRSPTDRAEVGTARYYAYLPARPDRPFTREKAGAYLDAILALLARDGPPGQPTALPWTRSEEKNLYRLARVWRHRAAGRDARWLLVGSRGGRLAAPIEQALQTPADPAWTQEE